MMNSITISPSGILGVLWVENFHLVKKKIAAADFHFSTFRFWLSIFSGRIDFEIMANLCGIPKYPKITKKSTKIQKIRGSSWLAQPIQTTPKSIQMAFYGTLGMFKVIFDEN